MSWRRLLRKPTISFLSSRPRHISRRFQSSTPRPNDSKAQARANKVLDRVPRFLRPYTDGLRNAPISHLVSFLILHELTAVIPLIGLASFFHYTNWLPSLADNPAIATYIEKFTRYFRRKGWFGFSEGSVNPTSGSDREDGDGDVRKKWDRAGRGTRIVLEVATAYAITKALLPVRLMLSVYATPWFARVVVGAVWGGLLGLGRRVLGRGSATAGAGAARMGSSPVGKDAPKK